MALLLPAVNEATALIAVRALAELGVRTLLVRDALARVLESPQASRKLQEECALALCLLGDERGLSGSLAALRGGELEQRRRAALALARVHRSEGVELLKAWLLEEGTAETLQDSMIEVLRELRVPSLVPLWLQLLEHPRLAPIAAEVLGTWRTTQAIPALETLAHSTRYVLTRRAATLALIRMHAPSAPELLRFVLSHPTEAPAQPFALARALSEPGHSYPALSLPAPRALGPEPTGPVPLWPLATARQHTLYLRLRCEQNTELLFGPSIRSSVDRGESTVRVLNVGRLRAPRLSTTSAAGCVLFEGMLVPTQGGTDGSSRP